MPTKKRAFQQGPVSNLKRQRKFQDEHFQSQDIWKNLDRVRTTNSDAENEIRNSYLFITIFTKNAISEYKSCIKSLHGYVDAEKLRLSVLEDDFGCITLKNFTLLDCCLVLAVLFAMRNKRWIAANEKEYFSIPSNVALAGSVYLPENCTWHCGERHRTSVPIVESRFPSIFGFRELSFSVSNSTSLTSFIGSLSALFSNIKFGKSTDSIIKVFHKSAKRRQEGINLSLYEDSLPFGFMFDMAKVRKENLSLIETSKANMKAYGEELILSNNKAIMSKENPPTDDHQRKTTANTAGGSTLAIKQQALPTDRNFANLESSRSPRSGTSTYSANSSNNNFMTQEQIKDHCVATIKASMDVLKTKSPYQIFKLYVKCPRQHYADIVYQNLNDMRSKTNCNIVVLNLNNLHESNPWFDSIDVTPYTDSAQRPHPSTVRVISIGGIGEHMIKALDAISAVLNTPLPGNL